MTDQSNSAAERSAHVHRGDAPSPADWPVVRMPDGTWKLKSVVALEARIAELEAALKKKGCARDQATTQYCVEVIVRETRIAQLEAALKPLSCSCTGFCGVMGWLPADNDSCVRRQGRAALTGGKS